MAFSAKELRRNDEVKGAERTENGELKTQSALALTCSFQGA